MLTENVMLRIFLPVFAAFAACTPSPQDAVMHNSSLIPPTAAPGLSETMADGQNSVATMPDGRGDAAAVKAAQGPIPVTVSTVENPVSAKLADSSAEAQGRRLLSTAFVRIGPDGHMTVELHDGRTVILSNVVMRPKDYCGVVLHGTKYCGGYADIAAARPGGLAVSAEPESVASNAIKEEHSSSQRK